MATMTALPETAVQTISASTLGRYLVTPAAHGASAPLVVGFHGYGENAEQHLQALQEIPGVNRWHLASVQALHRFYQRRTGAVVGSWMTSQDRERAIRDNMAYVCDVISALRATDSSDLPLVFAGFSQGVAMAYRAALGAGRRCDGLLVLAGDVPPDIQDELAENFPPILLGCGRSDRWYTAAKLQADLTFLRSHEIAHETVVFDGGHEWHRDFYESAGRFLERIRTGRRGSREPAGVQPVGDPTRDA